MLAKTLHNDSDSAYSPGSCLLHMVVEQLIRSRSPRLINFGYGSPSYDYRATNVVLDYVSYWPIPRTWKSRVFHAGYTSLRRVVTAIKSGLPAKRCARPTTTEG